MTKYYRSEANQEFFNNNEMARWYSFEFKRLFTGQRDSENWPKEKVMSLYRLIDLLVTLNVLKHVQR